MRQARLAKARGRELHAQGALESDIVLLFGETDVSMEAAITKGSVLNAGTHSLPSIAAPGYQCLPGRVHQRHVT